MGHFDQYRPSINVRVINPLSLLSVPVLHPEPAQEEGITAGRQSDLQFGSIESSDDNSNGQSDHNNECRIECIGVHIKDRDSGKELFNLMNNRYNN